MSKLNSGPMSRIHTQAPVVIQCQFDENDFLERWRVKNIKNDYVKFEVEVSEGKANDISINDLVFQVGSSRNPRSTPLKTAPAVSSSLNGLCVRKMPNEKRSDHDLLQDGIRFIGVALQDTYNNKNGNKQKQLSVRVGGTVTIKNNSTKNIHLGDTILWSIPTRADMAMLTTMKQNNLFNTEYDVLDHKVRLMTVPYDAKEHGVDAQINLERMTENDPQKHTDIETAMINLLDFFGVDLSTTFDGLSPEQNEDKSKKFNQMVQGLVNSISDYHKDLERRKIGKALSFTKPGGDFDILLS